MKTQASALGHNHPKPEWFGKSGVYSQNSPIRHCYMCLTTAAPENQWLPLKRDGWVCSDYCYQNYCMGWDLV